MSVGEITEVFDVTLGEVKAVWHFAGWNRCSSGGKI